MRKDERKNVPHRILTFRFAMVVLSARSEMLTMHSLTTRAAARCKERNQAFAKRFKSTPCSHLFLFVFFPHIHLFKKKALIPIHLFQKIS